MEHSLLNHYTITGSKLNLIKKVLLTNFVSIFDLMSLASVKNAFQEKQEHMCLQNKIYTFSLITM